MPIYMFSHITFSYCTWLLNHRACYQSHLSYTLRFTWKDPVNFHFAY